MKLKINLLVPILENTNTPNKYSKAYLSLNNVFQIEDRHNYKFDVLIMEQYQRLTYKYGDFINKIPLTVIEKYYNVHQAELNKHCFIMYGEHELADLTVIEIYTKLEDFFNSCFSLACRIADLYNLEVKLNNPNNNDKQEFF